MSEYEVVLQRQWDMLQMLATSEKGLTLNEMALKFAVSEKTIKRDLQSIESVFGKLNSRCEAHGRKRYWYANQFFAFSFILNREELMALYICLKYMEFVHGSALGSSFESAFEKIKQSLRQENVDIAERIAPFCYQFEPTRRLNNQQMAKTVDAIANAIDRTKVLKITYRSLQSRVAKTYEMCPYNFVYWRSGVYVVGYAPHDRKIKIWKLDRLVSAEILENMTFKRPRDFNVDEYLENVVTPYVGHDPVVTATCRFTGYAARIVQEERWHNVQELREEESGAVIMKIKTEMSTSFVRTILGFGLQAEILDPPQLRTMLFDEIRRLGQSYSRSAEDPIEYYRRIDAIAGPEEEPIKEVAEDEDVPERAPAGESELEYLVEIDDILNPKPIIKRKRGRPRKYPIDLTPKPKRRRGRPLGVRNKPKPPVVEAAAAAPAPVKPAPAKQAPVKPKAENPPEEQGTKKRRRPLTGKELLALRRGTK